MCKSIPPGKGNLYRCLFDHMNEPTMKSKVCCGSDIQLSLSRIVYYVVFIVDFWPIVSSMSYWYSLGGFLCCRPLNSCYYMYLFFIVIQCRRQLMRRGKEESQDYRMDYKFTTACSMAIKRYNCDKEAYTEGSFTKTVNILRCLNNLATQGVCVCACVRVCR